MTLRDAISFGLHTPQDTGQTLAIVTPGGAAKAARGETPAHQNTDGQLTRRMYIFIRSVTCVPKPRKLAKKVLALLRLGTRAAGTHDRKPREYPGSSGSTYKWGHTY